MPAQRQFKPLPHDSPLSGRFGLNEPSGSEEPTQVEVDRADDDIRESLPAGPVSGEPAVPVSGEPEPVAVMPSPPPVVDLVPDPEGENFDYREVLDVYRRHAAAGISFLEMSLDAQMERHGIPSPDQQASDQNSEANAPDAGMAGSAQDFGSPTEGVAVESLPTEPVDEGMLGKPVDQEATFYPNLETFVERFLANVFPFHQNATKPIEWASDWYRYPALVFPLDSIWRGYETARTRPGAMESWYFQTFQLLSLILNKDSGIMGSLHVESSTTIQGQPLPCNHPDDGWRQNTLQVLSAGPEGETEQEPAEPEEGGTYGF